MGIKEENTNKNTNKRNIIEFRNIEESSLSE